MLAHLAFFEALAALQDNTTPAWRSVAGGLVVLRLVDSWLDCGPHVVTTDVSGLRAIREVVTSVPEGDPVRSILNGVLEKMMDAEQAKIGVISSNLLAYGRALHYAGEWKLARDVFDTLATRGSKAKDHELTLQASLRLGFVCRRVGDLEASDVAYNGAARAASRISDPEGRLRAQLGRAQNVVARGNLGDADQVLAELIEAAKEAKIAPVLADALHERSHLSHLRKDFAEAVRLGYAALEYAQDPLARDRILGNIAAAFAELGHLSAARDAHLIVAATTQEEWLRHQTLINLMEIAVREGHEPSFHSYRKLLAPAPLQPFMRGYYHLYSGQGYRAFGHSDNAAAEFREALSVANAHDLNQLAFTAEAELEQLEAPSAQAVVPEWPHDLWEIATAIGEMRELAAHANNAGAP